MRICFSTHKIVNSVLHDVLTTEKRTQDSLDGILKRKGAEAAVVFREQAGLGTLAQLTPSDSPHAASETYVSLEPSGMQSNARQV